MQVRTPIKVRGYHIDLYQHVNNARYLEFLEEGRWHFLEQQPGLAELMAAGWGMAVVNININFRRGAFMGEELEVLTALTKVGNKSALIEQKVVLAGTNTVIVDADVTFVVTDQQAQKSVPLEGRLKEIVMQWYSPKVTAPVITVDGPGGAGKGTVTMQLAKQLGWHLLDSGALYRLVSVAAEQAKVELTDAAGLAQLAENLDVEFLPNEQDLVAVKLNGQDVSQVIRAESVAGRASQVAALDGVRAALLARQQNFAQTPGLIGDGRDLGTVVFPQAELKIYLTASAEERAKRRLLQLQAKGLDGSLEEIQQAIEERDERDQNRAIAPLKPAADALIIDSTNLSVEEVVQQILQEAKNRGLLPASQA